MTKDFTSLQIDQKGLPVPMVETKPTIAAVMPAAAMEQPFMGNYPFFPPFSSLPFPLPGDRGQMFPMFDNLSQHVYPTAAHRWPMQDYQDPKAVCMDTQFYSMPFQLPPPPAMEPYPVDPCPSTVPSTSVAPTQVEYKPIDYVMSRNPAAAAYNYNMLQYGDFASPQAITANWKAAAMKGSNSSKSDIPPPKHRTGPGTNNVRVRTQDTYRVVYTDAQRTELELEYQSQPFISADRKAELSGRLNLTERQVKIWFQNRRAKDRRDKRNKN